MRDMTTPTIPFGIRTRSGLPARHLPDPMSQHAIQTIARAAAALAEPWVGITTDGHVEPRLFSLSETGVSTRPIQAAAEAYLASLTEADQIVTSFRIDDLAW